MALQQSQDIFSQIDNDLIQTAVFEQRQGELHQLFSDAFNMEEEFTILNLTTVISL